jgi:hypothetical protein
MAAEIDSVTPRHLKLENAITEINKIMNQRIIAAIKNANPNSLENATETCDEESLYTELRKSIFQSYTASWGLKGYALDQQMRQLLTQYSYALSLNDSIYRDLNYIEAFSLNLKELSDVININGHLIGIDKMGHFFAEGWQYFELTQEQQTLKQAMDWGKQQEQGKFGYVTTGVFSFADLIANFNGWLFWNKVLLKNADPIKGGIANFFDRPYISCDINLIESMKQRRMIRLWAVNLSFDFSDYVDGAWDEGNNCNSYKDPIIENKVLERIKKVGFEFSCPYQVKHCINARNKYQKYAKYLLHPACLTRK